MASVLVFAKPDNIHPDPNLDWTKFKRGDVIEARDEDNFFWGNDIHGPKPLGWWRVIALPGVPASAVQSLVVGDPVPQGQIAPYRLRVNKIDLDALENGKVLNPSDSLAATLPDVLAVATVKPPIAVNAGVPA